MQKKRKSTENYAINKSRLHVKIEHNSILSAVLPFSTAAHTITKRKFHESRITRR